MWHGHKPGNRNSHKNKNEKEENNKKIEKYDNKNKKIDGVCFHCSQMGKTALRGWYDVHHWW